jgi:hypothetical protein
MEIGSRATRPLTEKARAPGRDSTRRYLLSIIGIVGATAPRIPPVADAVCPGVPADSLG